MSDAVTAVGKGEDDGFVSQYLNRPLSHRLSLFLARTPITPNQITWLGFLVGVAGAFLLATTDRGLWIWGGVAVQVASIVDGCDGEVARLKQVETARGGWLDTILDRYADLILGFAITYAATLERWEPWVWLVGSAAVTSFALSSYVTKEYSIRFEHPYPNTFFNRIKRRDLRILLLALGAVSGYPFEGLLLAGAINHASVVQILIVGWKREA